MSATNNQAPPGDDGGTQSTPETPRRLEREVRHELRTQLNQVIGYSDLLLDEAMQRELNDLIPDLQKIHVAGLRLLAMINDYVDPITRRADNMLPPTCETDAETHLPD